MHKKKIIITGGSGFIGTHLAKRLLADGRYEVVIIDLAAPKVEGVQYLQASMDETSKIEKVLFGADMVVHLAAMVGVDNCRLHPDQVQKVNYDDTKKFVDLCIAQGVKKFIFSSSSEIYGQSKKIPYSESATPEPVSLYATLKLAVEKYLLEQSTLMEIGIVRFFNIYGRGQNSAFVVSGFIRAAFENKPIIIFGEGNQIRCFTYVDDAVEGVIKLLEYHGSPYEIVNIGNAHETTINDLAQLILKKIPTSTSHIIHEQYDGAGIRELALEIPRRVPCVEKARKLLDFEARTPLDIGIDNIMEYYKKTDDRHKVSPGR